MDFIKTYSFDDVLMTEKYVNVQWNKQDANSSFLNAENYNQIKTNRTHDSRLRQCSSKQACSMVKSVLSKHEKRLYKLKQLQQENKNTKYLQRKITLSKRDKPKTDNINVELDPRFIDIQNGNNFDLFIQIKEIGNKEVIRIPIKHTKVSRKWLNKGKLLLYFQFL